MSSSSFSTTVSASAHLRLAPGVATPPSFTREQVRELVLEYLCSGCYADSAQAFARQVDHNALEATRSPATATLSSTVNGHGRGTGLDADGVEIGTGEMAMEGVEATPPPEGFGVALLGNGELDGELDSLDEDEQVTRELRGVNGKAVAFEGVQDVAGDEDELEDCSLLSKAQLLEVRLRRGASHATLRLNRVRRAETDETWLGTTDIRDSILNGRIQHAVDLLNEHFPAVLAEPPSSTPLPSSQPVPNTKSSAIKGKDACLPTTFFVSTPSVAPPVSATSPKPPVPVLGATFGSWSLSLDARILSLNLQLQTFVELMRSAHSNNTSLSTPSTPTANGGGGGGGGPGSDAGMSTSTSSLGGGSHSMNIAIAQSQALSANVRRLPAGRERDSWDQECIDVSGLMAYKDLTTCPVRGYLAQGRREVLAELVNAAVLRELGVRDRNEAGALRGREMNLTLLLLNRTLGQDSVTTTRTGSSTDDSRVGHSGRLEDAVPSDDRKQQGRQEQDEGEFAVDPTVIRHGC